MIIQKYIKETLKYALRSPLLIGRYVDEVERLYAMSADELRGRDSRRFVELFRTAYDRSPFYRKLYMESGISRDDISGIEDIGKLPVVTKAMLRLNTEQVRTEPRWRLIANHTSGTTGTPLKVWESWPAIWREQAYFYCYRRRCGYRYGQPLVSLRGNLTRGEMRLKVHASNTLFLSSYDINDGNAQFYYDNILRHKPVAIEGYPSSLYALALALRSRQLTLSIPVAFTSSETLFDYQRELIETQLGTTIYDHYGTTERTISLGESFDHSGYYADPGYSINEYTEDGEITTSLINFAFPLIRYKGTDIMEMAEPDCGMQVVRRIVGRDEDCVVCKDGTRVMRLDFVMKGVANVRQSQLVQESAGALRVLVVPDKGFSDEDRKRIAANLCQRVGAGNIDYTIETVDESALQYAGRKFKFLINLTTVKGGVKRIKGRDDDLIVCKDGSRLTRVDFVETAKHVKACQWVQRERGKLELLIVPDEGFTTADRQYIEECTLERTGHDNIDLSTTITTLDGLVYTRRGKFKLIVNQTKKENMNVLKLIKGGGKYVKETLKYSLRTRLFIGRYIKEIETLYAMTPDELRERNSRKFVALFRKAYDRSPFYRQLYSAAGIKRDDIKSIDDLVKLPVVTKDMLRHNTERIRIAPKWLLIPNHTSGTTGMPLKVWESWPAIWREQAYFHCYRRRCGFTYGQRLVSLRGDLGKGERPLKIHVSNTLFLSCYDINESTIEDYYNQIRRHRPQAIEGFSSTLYSLALLMRDRGMRLHIPVAFTSSETVLDYQRELIEKQFDTKLYDHYGTTERTISLNENFDHSGYHEEPGYSINEYVDDGEITTGLINYAFPLIRYKGTDVMEIVDGKVKRVGGRKDDVIICKDGSRVTRIAFVETARNVKACQWVQRERGKLELRIVPDEGFTQENAKYIEACTYERVGRDNIDLTTTITTMDGLHYTRRGKFKLIVNETEIE